MAIASKTFYASLILVLAGVLPAVAQEMVIFFQLRPPFDQPLEAYKDQLAINLTNPSGGNVTGFLEITIFNSDRSILIGSTLPGRKRITLEPGITSFTGTELNDLLDISRLNFTGVNADEVFFDQGLPAGRYYLCLEFYNTENTPISNTACTNFQVNVPAVAGALSLLPPYNVPFSELADQVTVTLTSSSSFTGVMEMAVTDFNNSIILKKKTGVTLEAGANVFSGSDLEYYFSAGEFTALSGITETQLFDAGLPAGNYLMTFTVTMDDAQVAVANRQFNVPVTAIAMNIRATPPFDGSLEDLLAQTTITVQSSAALSDVFLTMMITGEDALIETDRNAVVRSFEIQSNVPEILTAGDFIDVNGTGVQFGGTVAVDGISHGLPSGNFSYCFRLHDDTGQVLTAFPSCFSLNVPPAFLNISVQAIPPFVSRAEDLYNMLRVTVNPSRKMSIGFNTRIVGDNGIEISTDNRQSVPIPLEKNEPRMLEGHDLYPFFQPDQFLATGISPDKLRDSDLPEGNYQVCFTPFVNEGYPVENVTETCSNSFPIRYVEPPQLLTPACGQVFDISRGQFILFNWLPSPGVPPDTEYTLKIVEMRIRGQNPTDAILTATAPPFFEEKVIGTSYLYSPGDPLLEPGYEYAYVVYLGDEPLRGNYTNMGFSQACTFSVTDNTIVDDTPLGDTALTPTPRLVITTPIDENPFQGFTFPVSRVSGTLRHKFKDSTAPVLLAQTEDPSNIQLNSGNSNASGFYQQTDAQTDLQVSTGPGIRSVDQPSFNEDNTFTAGSLPLGGVSVKLVEGYLAYGTYLGENVSGKFIPDPWTAAMKTIASGTTDSDGNFELTFFQADSLGEANYVSPLESQISLNNVTGKLYKVYRLIVESPYYCSPEMNIVLQPWEQLEVGTLVSYVKSYELKVISKTGAKGDFWADQGGEVGITIPEVKTQLTRSNSIATLPDNEGQNLEGGLVSQGTTDAYGAVLFKRLVRHNFNNPLDTYTIQCETSENIGEYNFETTSQSYPLLNSPALGPYSYAVPIDFNSEWTIYQYVDTVTMYPELPRIFGEVNGNQPPAELSQVRKMNNTSEANGSFNTSTSNSSARNIMSTTLYQSDMTLSEFAGLYQQIPNWSEMVNKEALQDVTVNLWEFNNHWRTNSSSAIDKLQQQSDANGRFSFENLDLEITEEWAVGGPARVLFIEHPGYTKYYKKIPPGDGAFLKWGQQYEVDDILLEPDGFVFGYVQDEKGNPVKADVFIGEFTSATTVQSQEFQDILGIGGPLKELFIIKAPSGSHVSLHIVPDDPIYVPADYVVSVDESNSKIPQNLGGFNVGIYKHRIMVEVVEEEQLTGSILDGSQIKWNPPVKNALVKVTNLLVQGPAANTKNSQPSSGGITTGQQSNTVIDTDNVIYGYTDENGFVTLTFSNNSQEFEIEVIPPADKNLVKKKKTITSEPSGTPVYAGKVVLEKARSLSGMVTYGGNGSPLPNARVYIDNDLEAFTNAAGKYTIHYIPEQFTEFIVTAENLDHPLTLIAETKTVQMPVAGSLDFNLIEFNDFEIKSLMDIPVTVKSITPSGNNYLLDGAFIDLPGNENFSVKEENTQLKFHQVPVTGVQKDGKVVAKAVNSSIALDEGELNLINFTRFLAKQTPLSGNQLVVTANSEGQGSITGKVVLLNSSFHFDQHYISFNEETLSPSSADGFVEVQQAKISTDNMQRTYIELFNDQSQFRLFNKQQNTNVVKTLSVSPYLLQPFGVSDQNNHDYEFKVQEFKAVAKKTDSYVYRDTLVLATTLIADNIPLTIPKTLEVDAGNIIVSAYGFEKILGGEPLTFKLEQWQITCDNWSLTPNTTGIIAPTGKIDFGIFTTDVKDIKILPGDLQLGGLDLNKFKLGDIVPIHVKTNTTISFGIDNAAGSDDPPAPHWVMSLLGFNNQPAASVKGLPGMIPTDEIGLQEVQLISNGEQKMIIGNQDKPLTFYNIVKVTPDKFTMLDGGLQLSAALDLEIPLLTESYGSFRYTKPGDVVESQFLGMDVDFTMPGNTMFVGNQNLGAQTLAQDKFEAIGYIKHEEKVKLFTRMVKDLDSTYIYVDPLHQTLAIADDGSNYMAEVTGGTRALQDDWNKFVFSGDLTGMKGVEDSQKRKTFTINGSINAENEGLDVKNISAGFGGMKITYDFENDRLTGSLDFNQQFSAVEIAGHADFLTDSQGWLFIAGGSVKTPGFGQLKAGLGIGDYGNMSVQIEGNSIESLLLQDAHNKNLPSGFQSGFSGFFFTGMKDIPQLSIPETGFDFLFISGSLELTTGFDARLWMAFDESAAEFGVGVMAFAELTLMVDASLSCSSLYGYVGLELGVEGKYNTGTGHFSLEGCASIAIAGAAEQCSIPVCNPPCLSGCDYLALKATMYFDSDGNIDAGFALGSCGGGNPLNQEIKDKFNCD